MVGPRRGLVGWGNMAAHTRGEWLRVSGSGGADEAAVGSGVGDLVAMVEDGVAPAGARDRGHDTMISVGVVDDLGDAAHVLGAGGGAGDEKHLGALSASLSAGAWRTCGREWWPPRLWVYCAVCNCPCPLTVCAWFCKVNRDDLVERSMT